MEDIKEENERMGFSGSADNRMIESEFTLLKKPYKAEEPED